MSEPCSKMIKILREVVKTLPTFSALGQDSFLSINFFFQAAYISGVLAKFMFHFTHPWWHGGCDLM